MSESKAQQQTIDPHKVIIYGTDVPAPEGTFLQDGDQTRQVIVSAFMKQVAEIGITAAVTCRKVGDDLVVVNGRRRVAHLRAANELRKENNLSALKLPYVIEKGGDNKTAAISRITANLFGEGHNMIAQAHQIEELKALKYSTKDCAVIMGMSQGSISGRLKLLKLPEEIQAHVEAGRIGQVAATALGKIDDVAKAVELADEHVEAKQKNDDLLDQIERETKPGGDKDKGKAEDEEHTARPSVAVLNKMRKTAEFENLAPDAQKFLRWMIGELKTLGSVSGGTDCLRAATKKKIAPPKVDGLEE